MSGPYSIGGDLWPGLSKLIEEAGEVSQVAGKLLGSGGKSEHWDGTNLRDRMEEELSDLVAASIFVIRHNSLDELKIERRIQEKLATFEKWREAGQ